MAKKNVRTLLSADAFPSSRSPCMHACYWLFMTAPLLEMCHGCDQDNSRQGCIKEAPAICDERQNDKEKKTGQVDQQTSDHNLFLAIFCQRNHPLFLMYTPSTVSFSNNLFSLRNHGRLNRYPACMLIIFSICSMISRSDSLLKC